MLVQKELIRSMKTHTPKRLREYMRVIIILDRRRLDISQLSLPLMSQLSRSGHREILRTKIEIAKNMGNEVLLNFSVKSNRTLIIYFNPG